jgi:hypothetical protein
MTPAGGEPICRRCGKQAKLTGCLPGMPTCYIVTGAMFRSDMQSRPRSSAEVPVSRILVHVVRVEG